MLDRMSLLVPDWVERTPADVGVALVETLAYVADELSYRQDAVATEAYLATARRRTSLRRHARLVDYVVHEGSNARAWVRVFVDAGNVSLSAGTPLLTRVPGVRRSLEPRQPRAPRGARGRRRDVRDRRARRAPRGPRALRLLDVGRRRLLPAEGRDLGDARRRPPRSSQPGDVLVFAEVAGPDTGKRRRRRPREARRGAADERHAVHRPVRRAVRRPADRTPRSP